MSRPRPGSAEPRFYTPRDPSRKTLGKRWGKVSRALGQPYMPHQQQIADVAGEIDPDTGELYYHEVVITVPRQSGKTTIVLSVGTDRCVAPWPRGRQRVVYTAQTRNDARGKLLEEQAPIVAGSMFGPLMRKREQAGSEGFLWANGSRTALMATTKKSGHGPTVDVAFLDEFFAQTDNRLEQAVRPSMITRPSSQLWVLSTAGDETSGPLRRKVNAGRERSEAGRHGRIAYCEYSAPDGSDPDDPATWWACMPALGFTQTEEKIQAEREGLEGGLDEFCRAYLNMWRDGVAIVQVIPAGDWSLCADPHATLDGRVAFALDVSPDMGTATISVGGLTKTGNPSGHVIDPRPGTSWVVPRLKELVTKWRPLALAIDPASPAASLLNEIVAAKLDVPLLLPTPRDFAQASQSFYAMATVQTVEGDDGQPRNVPPVFRHRNEPHLNAALAAAVKKPSGDAGWMWSRAKSAGDITPLVSVNLAVWAHQHEFHRVVDPLASIW